MRNYNRGRQLCYYENAFTVVLDDGRTSRKLTIHVRYQSKNEAVGPMGLDTSQGSRRVELRLPMWSRYPAVAGFVVFVAVSGLGILGASLVRAYWILHTDVKFSPEDIVLDTKAPQAEVTFDLTGRWIRESSIQWETHDSLHLEHLGPGMLRISADKESFPFGNDATSQITAIIGSRQAGTLRIGLRFRPRQERGCRANGRG